LTDGQTDRQTPRRWLRRAKHFAIARNDFIVISIHLENDLISNHLQNDDFDFDFKSIFKA